MNNYGTGTASPRTVSAGDPPTLAAAVGFVSAALRERIPCGMSNRKRRSARATPCPQVLHFSPAITRSFLSTPRTFYLRRDRKLAGKQYRGDSVI